LQPLLRLIAVPSEEIKTFDQRLEKLAAEKYMHTQLLRQVSGVGPVTALAYVLTLETPLRFARVAIWGLTWGLCPSRKTPETSNRNWASGRPETECCASCWWEAHTIFWDRLVRTPIYDDRLRTTICSGRSIGNDIHRLVRVTAINRPVLRDRRLDCSTQQPGFGPQIAPDPKRPIQSADRSPAMWGCANTNSRAIVKEAYETKFRSAEPDERTSL
jgi:hypothetical protein